MKNLTKKKKISIENSSISEGWLSTAKKLVSPNYNSRNGVIPRLVVIHNISLPPAEFGGSFIEDFFQNKLDSSAHPYFETIKNLEVSSHLLIKRTGEIIQFVSFEDRAWHAGQSSYLGIPACNDYSIGIELEGCDDQGFTEEQYLALSESVKAIHTAYPETKNHLTGHSDIAPGRKTDPGDFFEWQKIRKLISS